MTIAFCIDRLPASSVSSPIIKENPCEPAPPVEEGLYFTDDALQNRYYFDDALTRRYKVND